ncbi:MAG: MBL fold metallo-hydrolase [Anaerolineaceae bacterium]|nr:MBL fold metallo-hydrolase [Anaerolineaceae bacterium]
MSEEITTIQSGGVNCYLVKIETGFILIDSGLSNKRAKIEKALESAGCQPGDLKLILLTHADSDHAGNCASLREKYGAKIAMHPAESAAAESGDMRLSRKKAPFLANMIFSFFKLNKADRFKPDFTVDEGSVLSDFGFDARVLYLPGHSLGSIGILTGSGDLFCGDLLVNTDQPAINSLVDNPQDIKASFERLYSLNIKTAYPGHGKAFELEQLLKKPVNLP